MEILIYLLAGIVWLYYGAEWLVKGSSSLALRFGVSPLVVGLTVVAFGTSAPEMVVSVKAAVDGFGSIAIGNVVGSNIVNIALILGLAALIQPLKVHKQVLKVDTPLMIAASVIVVAFLQDQILQRWEAGLLFIGILLYIILTIHLGRKNKRQSSLVIADRIHNDPTGSTTNDLMYIVAGLACLVLGSHVFVRGAVKLAVILGVSQAVIALTIVALGTSLPELATSVVASIKRQEDIAVGNIIGSNIFNLLAILGVSGLVAPLTFHGVGLVDLVVMVSLSALLLPLMRRRFLLGRVEGLLLLTIYLAYLIHLWPKTAA